MTEPTVSIQLNKKKEKLTHYSVIKKKLATLAQLQLFM